MRQLIFMIPETEEEKANHNPIHGLAAGDGKLYQDGEVLVDLAIRLLNQVCFKNSFAHGWYEKYMETIFDPSTGANKGETLGERNFGEVMALITSEVSEAFEAFRDGDDQCSIKYAYKGIPGFSDQPMIPAISEANEPILGKPEGIAAELADVLIRVFDYAGAYGVPLAEAVIRKHLYNNSRPYRHGGKLA